ncbi:MAG: hypothetical protein L6V82_01265 [Clostridiales bacterium]|nr:MAG: hypothetical protein L6V82_01265 [Clostridiales bacterium]
MNKTNKTNNKNKKEELSPLYKKLSLGPEIRAEEPKGVYPKGRVKQVFAVMSGEMNSLMRVNAWFLLFAIPLFFVLYWCSNYFTSLATSKFDFMGNVGMAFPGGADTLQQAQIAVYDAWQIVFYLLVPAITITFIGMAGAFNCLKAFMWGEKVEKITKTFFKGVKKYWWKYLIVMLVDSLLVLALGSAFVFFLKLKVMGALNAGHWVMIIVVCLVEFLLLYVNMQLLPMIAEVDLPFLKQVKLNPFQRETCADRSAVVPCMPCADCVVLCQEQLLLDNLACRDDDVRHDFVRAYVYGVFAMGAR